MIRVCRKKSLFTVSWIAANGSYQGNTNTVYSISLPYALNVLRKTHTGTFSGTKQNESIVTLYLNKSTHKIAIELTSFNMDLALLNLYWKILDLMK